MSTESKICQLATLKQPNANATNTQISLEMYLKPCQAFNMELFVELVNNLKPHLKCLAGF